MTTQRPISRGRLPLILRSVIRDAGTSRGRMALLVVAVAVSVAAIGALLGARAIVQRELAANYAATVPASATLELSPPADAADVAAVLDVAGVARAAVRGVVRVGARAPGQDRAGSFLLFVIEPDDPLAVARFDPESGTWPPTGAGMLVERSTAAFFDLADGDRVTLDAPGHDPVAVTVSGQVHDPSLSPSDQETIGYGYVTPDQVGLLGLDPELDDLKVLVEASDGSGGSETDRAAIAEVVTEVSRTLDERGITTVLAEIPPPLAHPHEAPFQAATGTLLWFGVLALVLSAVVVASTVGAMVAQRIRQIGAMKAVGATTRDVLVMYLALVGTTGVVAVAVAAVPGLLAGRFLAGRIAGLMNIDLTSTAVPWWVYALQVAAGVVVPVIVAVPILIGGCRVTVRQALDSHGVTGATVGRRLGPVAWLDDRVTSLAVGNLTRRRGRLLLSLTLLASAGGMFTAGIDTAEAWNAQVADGIANRHYDLQLTVAGTADREHVRSVVSSLDEVASSEIWNSLPTGVPRPDGLVVTDTYPDGGHGSFSLTALPADTDLFTPRLLAGRWLDPGEERAVVLNQLAAGRRLAGVEIGDEIELITAGVPATWTVVGVVSDFGSQGTAYVTTEGAVSGGIDPDDGLDLRLVTGADTESVVGALRTDGVPVAGAVTVDQLEEALDGHVLLLVDVVLALGVVMAVVGLLGLATSLATGVIERTRELGVLRAVGATGGDLRRIVVTEGTLVGLLSVPLAVPVAVALTVVLGRVIGRQAFELALPFRLSGAAIGIWAGLAVAGAAAASLGAARRATRLTVRETLSHL